MRLLLSWFLLLLAPNAFGDALLVDSVPAADAEIPHFEGKVVFRFRGNISERWPSLVVVDEFGNRVDRGEVQIHIVKDGAELSTVTPPLAPGRYAVRYRVLSEDGLVLSGIQYFKIR
ncbi:MAG: copper resistance protein CopC [Methylohalobius sp.]|nr:copper resistance protein CopC [Methylohalobius sp.]